MALEPQPRAGALAAATAGPPRRAVETAFAAAAALPDPPGIDAGPGAAQLLRAWVPCSIVKRPRRMGLRGEVADGRENLEDHPTLATRYARRKTPFQRPKSFARPVEPFSFRPDITFAWDIASLGE